MSFSALLLMWKYHPDLIKTAARAEITFIFLAAARLIFSSSVSFSVSSAGFLGSSLLQSLPAIFTSKRALIGHAVLRPTENALSWTLTRRRREK